MWPAPAGSCRGWWQQELTARSCRGGQAAVQCRERGIMHFDGDRVVREWIGADNLGLFIQLGVVDNPWPG